VGLTPTHRSITTQDPDLTFGGIGKRLGELWRGLSDAEKAKYNK
jgi:hypothetical protein